MIDITRYREQKSRNVATTDVRELGSTAGEAGGSTQLMLHFVLILMKYSDGNLGK